MGTTQQAPTRYLISFSWPADKRKNAGNASRELKDIAPTFRRGMRIAENEIDAIAAKRILERNGADVTVQKSEDAVPLLAAPQMGTEPVRVQITYRNVRNIDKDVKTYQDKIDIVARRNNSIIVRGRRDVIHEFLLQLKRDGGKDISLEQV